MNILILTNKDFASLVAMNLLLPELTEHKITLGTSEKVGGQQTLCDSLKKLAGYERQLLENADAISFKPLKAWLNQSSGSLLDKKSSNTSDFNEKPMEAVPLASFEKLSLKYTLDCIAFDNINQKQGLIRVKQLSPALILSVRFGKILQQPIIDLPSLGVINLHSGLLPQYQGVMASFWSMLAEEEFIGSCLHRIIDKKIDSGPILKQKAIALKSQHSYLYNVLSLYPAGCQMILEAVNELCKGDNLYEGDQLVSKTANEKAGYFGFPKEINIEQFVAKGFRLYDPKENLSEALFSQQRG